MNSQTETDRLIGPFFSTIGLRRYDGTPRPALDVWHRAVDTRESVLTDRAR